MTDHHHHRQSDFSAAPISLISERLGPGFAPKEGLRFASLQADSTSESIKALLSIGISPSISLTTYACRGEGEQGTGDKGEMENKLFCKGMYVHNRMLEAGSWECVFFSPQRFTIAASVKLELPSPLPYFRLCLGNGKCVCWVFTYLGRSACGTALHCRYPCGFPRSDPGVLFVFFFLNYDDLLEKNAMSAG